MEKKQTRRESRETAFLTAFAATFEPETPLVPAETESAAPDAFATQLLAAMNDHAAELDEIGVQQQGGRVTERTVIDRRVAAEIAQREQCLAVPPAHHADERGCVGAAVRPGKAVRRVVAVQRRVIPISFAQVVEKQMERALRECAVERAGLVPFIKLSQLIAHEVQFLTRMRIHIHG